MISLTEIERIIQNGKNENIEFKTSFNTELIETIVAFANTSGGKVIVGINPKAEIIGTTINAESVQQWVNEIKNKTSPVLIPDVETISLNNKTIVIFSIQEYPVKPVAIRGKYFKRVANSNHLMSIDEIANEYLKTINTSWDFYPDPNHSIEHISAQKVKRFVETIEQQTQKRIEIPHIDFLAKLEIIRNHQLTFGGYLLFVKEYCLISDVQVGRFKSPTTIIDSTSLNTDLFTEVDEIIAFIKKHLMVEYIITGAPQRTERFDYPLDAIREIVINMIVHRDYRDSSSSIIKIFDDRIEFFNPGKLYGGITIDDLLSGNYSSKTRNKLIARAFKEVGLIEKYGSGIRRVLNICEEYGVKQPKFEEVFNGFRVLLFKEKTDVTNDVINDVTKNVTKEKRLIKILKLVESNPSITTGEIALRLELTPRTVLRDIDQLKTENRLRRVGGRKKGKWIIIKNE